MAQNVFRNNAHQAHWENCSERPLPENEVPVHDMSSLYSAQMSLNRLIADYQKQMSDYPLDLTTRNRKRKPDTSEYMGCLYNSQRPSAQEINKKQKLDYLNQQMSTDFHTECGGQINVYFDQQNNFNNNYNTNMLQSVPAWAAQQFSQHPQNRGHVAMYAGQTCGQNAMYVEGLHHPNVASNSHVPTFISTQGFCPKTTTFNGQKSQVRFNGQKSQVHCFPYLATTNYTKQVNQNRVPIANSDFAQNLHLDPAAVLKQRYQYICQHHQCQQSNQPDNSKKKTGNKHKKPKKVINTKESSTHVPTSHDKTPAERRGSLTSETNKHMDNVLPFLTSSPIDHQIPSIKFLTETQNMESTIANSSPVKDLSTKFSLDVELTRSSTTPLADICKEFHIQKALSPLSLDVEFKHKKTKKVNTKESSSHVPTSHDKTPAERRGSLTSGTNKHMDNVLPFLTSSPIDHQIPSIKFLTETKNMESTIENSSPVKDLSTKFSLDVELTRSSTTPLADICKEFRIQKALSPLDVTPARETRGNQQPRQRGFGIRRNSPAIVRLKKLTKTKKEIQFNSLKEQAECVKSSPKSKRWTNYIPCVSYKPDTSVKYCLNENALGSFTKSIQRGDYLHMSDGASLITTGIQGTFTRKNKGTEDIFSEAIKNVDKDSTKKPAKSGEGFWEIKNLTTRDETKALKSCNPGLKLRHFIRKATGVTKKHYNVSREHSRDTVSKNDSYTKLQSISPAEQTTEMKTDIDALPTNKLFREEKRNHLDKSAYQTREATEINNKGSNPFAEHFNCLDDSSDLLDGEGRLVIDLTRSSCDEIFHNVSAFSC